MRGGEERLGRFLYHWDETCFPLGADALALGEFCTLRPGDRVLDLGCGAGVLLLLCARREPGAVLTGVELDPGAAALARRNLADNGLAGTVLTGDLGALELPRADLVVSNPPWYPQGSGRTGRPGRMEGNCTLPTLCRAAGKALGAKGRFALVHRPERLSELMAALQRERLEPKRLCFCRHAPDQAPYAVLLEAVKEGRPELKILPDVIG